MNTLQYDRDYLYLERIVQIPYNVRGIYWYTVYLWRNWEWV